MTQSQKRALNAVQNMIEVKTDEVFAHNIMILIFGILNIEHDTDKDTINPNDVANNDKLQMNIPDWIVNKPTPPFAPGDYQPPQVWYKREPETIPTDVRDGTRYITEMTCMDDKNGIVHTTNTGDVQYNGDFRDEQTSFDDK